MVRGQTFSIELFILSMSVILILTIFLFALSTINDFKTKVDENDRRNYILTEVSNILLLSKGYPYNWESNLTNNSSISALGIATRRNIINPLKISSLNETDYITLLSLYYYNVSINVTWNGQLHFIGWSNSTAENIAIVRRNCIVNNTLCIFEIEVSK